MIRKVTKQIRKTVRRILYRLGLVKHKGHFMDYAEELGIQTTTIKIQMEME